MTISILREDHDHERATFVTPIDVVLPNTPEEMRAAALTVVDHCLTNDISVGEMKDLLGAIGAVEKEKKRKR